MKQFLTFLFALAMSVSVSAQVAVKYNSSGQLTEPSVLKVPTGKSIRVESGGTLVIDVGGTASLPSNVFSWASVNKTGSSLADLVTRSATDLTSGTLPDARFPSTLPALNGSLLTALNATNIASGTLSTARLPSTMTGINSITAASGTPLTLDGGASSLVINIPNSGMVIRGTVAGSSYITSTYPGSRTDAQLSIINGSGTGHSMIDIVQTLSTDEGALNFTMRTGRTAYAEYIQGGSISMIAAFTDSSGAFRSQMRLHGNRVGGGSNSDLRLTADGGVEFFGTSDSTWPGDRVLQVSNGSLKVSGNGIAGVGSIFNNTNRLFIQGDTGGIFLNNAAGDTTLLSLSNVGAAAFTGAVSGPSFTVNGGNAAAKTVWSSGNWLVIQGGTNGVLFQKSDNSRTLLSLTDAGLASVFATSTSVVPPTGDAGSAFFVLKPSFGDQTSYLLALDVTSDANVFTYTARAKNGVNENTVFSIPGDTGRINFPSVTADLFYTGAALFLHKYTPPGADVNASNLWIGEEAGNRTMTFTSGAAASFNTAGGYQSGKAVTTGNKLALWGWGSGRSITSGFAVSAIGYQSVRDLTTGSHITALGTDGVQSATTATNIVGIGVHALQFLTTASNVVGIGEDVGLAITTQGGGVYLGSFAGKYTTTANEFFVNNRDLGDAATEVAQSLLYGQFNATLSSQTLRVNAGSTRFNGGSAILIRAVPTTPYIQGEAGGGYVMFYETGQTKFASGSADRTTLSLSAVASLATFNGALAAGSSTSQHTFTGAEHTAGVDNHLLQVLAGGTNSALLFGVSDVGSYSWIEAQSAGTAKELKLNSAYGGLVSFGGGARILGDTTAATYTVRVNGNRLIFQGGSSGYLFQNSGNTATLLGLLDSGQATVKQLVVSGEDIASAAYSLRANGNRFVFNGGTSGYLFQNADNTSTLLTVTASAVTLPSGSALQLGNAYSAEVFVPTGVVLVKDSTGTTYKVGVSL